MPAKPLFALREAPRFIPDRIRDFDAGIRLLIRPSLIYGVPCALVAFYLYRTEIAPLIAPPPNPDPSVGILAAPFLFPAMFMFPRLFLSFGGFRNAWRTTWWFWPTHLTWRFGTGARSIPWRDILACTVEPLDEHEITLRLAVAPPLSGQDTELVLTCLRTELPCDIDSLRERIAALMTAARPFSG
jgi:hypothetical protein